MHWLGLIKGGPGSGNFGHAGRPGQVGGSAPGDGSPSSGGSHSGFSPIPAGDKAESSRDLVKLGKYDDWKDTSGKRQVTLFHYSREDRTGTGLRREFAGTAGAGQEKRSFEYDDNGKPRPDSTPIHAYMYGAEKESMVPGNVLHKITAELNVLDTSSSKYQEIKERAREEAEATGRPWFAVARNMAAKEGYDALSDPRYGMVQILRDVKPEELKVIKPGGMKYTPGVPQASNYRVTMRRKWDVKLHTLARPVDPGMELESLKMVANNMVEMGALSKEDRHAILGNMVGEDLKEGLPAINAKIEELKSKMPSSVSEEDKKEIARQFKYSVTFGKTKETLEKEMLEQAEHLMAGRKVAVRVPFDIANKVVEDGRFKSQFETNDSQGALNPELRSKAEAEMFGVPEDIEPHERPIYGYWSDADGEHDKSGLEYYGGVAFMLKDDVRDRSTVTFGDSLDSELPGSKLDKLNIVSMEINEGLVGRDNFSYIEAQVHGGASIDDVEEVIISDYAMGKIIKTYNAATDHQGERGEFKGFHSGLLFSGDFKVSVILRPTREEMGAASWASTKKVTLREYLESEKFKKYHAGTEGGDAFIAHLEKKDGGKKDGGKKDDGKKAGSDSRPSWW